MAPASLCISCSAWIIFWQSSLLHREPSYWSSHSTAATSSPSLECKLLVYSLSFAQWCVAGYTRPRILNFSRFYEVEGIGGTDLQYNYKFNMGFCFCCNQFRFFLIKKTIQIWRSKFLCFVYAIFAIFTQFLRFLPPHTKLKMNTEQTHPHSNGHLPRRLVSGFYENPSQPALEIQSEGVEFQFTTPTRKLKKVTRQFTNPTDQFTMLRR